MCHKYRIIIIVFVCFRGLSLSASGMSQSEDDDTCNTLDKKKLLQSRVRIQKPKCVIIVNVEKIKFVKHKKKKMTHNR